MNKPNNRNQGIIDEFRRNSGKVGGHFAGRNLLLLHTNGARTGEPRVNPVAYTADGDRLVVIASKGGSDTNPHWYHNLVADPQVEVEVGTEKFSARAAVAAEPERSRLYDQMVSEFPAFADYKTKTDRVIPVIVLTPVKY
jgi:deazaflavin-dependent oxidoreductase (nitroreductase family)